MLSGKASSVVEPQVLEISSKAVFGRDLKVVLLLSGLTVGDDYEIQILANDARGNRSDNFNVGYGDGLGAAGEQTIGSGVVLLNNQA